MDVSGALSPTGPATFKKIPGSVPPPEPPESVDPLDPLEMVPQVAEILSPPCVAAYTVDPEA